MPSIHKIIRFFLPISLSTGYAMGMILDIPWYFNILPLIACALAVGILGKTTPDRISFFASIIVPIWLVNNSNALPTTFGYQQYLLWLSVWGIFGIFTMIPEIREHIDYYHKTNQLALVFILAVNIILVIFVTAVYPDMMPTWLFALIILPYPFNIMGQEKAGSLNQRAFLGGGAMLAGVAISVATLLLDPEIISNPFPPLSFTTAIVTSFGFCVAGLLLSLALFRADKRRKKALASSSL